MGSMYMGTALFLDDPGNSLLTSNLTKFWTVNESLPSVCPQTGGISSLLKSTESKALAGGKFTSRMSPGARKVGIASRSFAKLDLTTLKNLGWSQASKDEDVPKVLPRVTTAAVSCSTGEGVGENSHSAGHSNEEPESKLYRLTKVEFRRLTEQVRDVSNDLKNKLRKSPVEQKLYRLTPASSPNPGIQKLHDELQASRLPFQTRQWRHLDVPEQTLVRCRPVSARPKTAHVHSTTTTNCAPQRPCSVPLNGSPHSDNPLEGRLPRPPSSPRPDTPFVSPGNYDTLTPRVLSQLLVDDYRPSSAAYGDRVITRAERKCSARDDKQRGSDDASTTSGVESDSGEAQGNDSDVDKKDDDDDEEDSSDSDAEGFEPSLDDARRQIPSAQSIFQLRPEKLDAIYIPQDKRDMRRFDFDAGNVELPPYEFKSPVPDSLESVNLRLCAKDGASWREQVSPGLVASLPQNVVGMVNRLVELEKYQLVTQEWEARKLRQQNKRQLSSSGGGQNRATSARVRDKRCCGLCLQAACVGDCPEKHLNVSGGGRCDRCFQLLCPGSCQDTKYEQRMRLTRSGSGILDLSDNPPPLPPRPVSLGCHSCQQRHNGKVINANNILLGRPKSSNSTYSRGKASASPHDLRPLSAASLNASLLKDFERMGIEPQQVATIAKRPSSRLRSRNGLVPGKSLRSNRRESLTEASHNRKRKFVFRRPRTGRPRTGRPNS